MNRLINDAGLSVVRWSTQGKWVNAGFLVYKLGRVFPLLAPRFLVRAFGRSPFARFLLYAPTGDIQYVSAHLP